MFTLVGIAGEDDLDAPDLNCQPVANGALRSGATPRGAGSEGAVPGFPGRGAGHGNGGGQDRAILSPDASAECRDRLLRAIVNLPSSEAAGEWARDVLPLKNTLIAGDALATTKQEYFLAIATQRPELHGPPAYYTTDWDAARESVRRLAALRPMISPRSGGFTAGPLLISPMPRAAASIQACAPISIA